MSRARSSRAVTISAFFSGVAVGALPFIEVLFLRVTNSRLEAVTVVAIGFVVALLLTLLPYRARTRWLVGVAAGFVGAWAMFGADWRLPIYLYGTHLISGPIGAGVLLGILIGLKIDDRADATFGSGGESS